jgi:protein-tyrosine phosphatase
MMEKKIDIQKHMSRAITEELVDSSEVITVMTQSHFDRVVGVYPSAREKCFLLRSFDPAADSTDLEDPLGGSDDFYVITRKRIESAMPGLVSFLKELQIDGNSKGKNK